MGIIINLEEIIGKKFGRLTPIKKVESYVDPKSNQKSSMFLCKCDCGNEKEIRLTCFKSGHTKSCGCYNVENRTKWVKAMETHGECKTAEYKCWAGTKTRCYNKKNNRYKGYGGKGVKVCGRWLNSYENFLADMGRKPSPQHSIDRIDVNGDYCPENCRWATRKEQANNTINTLHIEYNGEIKPLSVWAKLYNINRQTLHSRIYKCKMPIDKAINYSRFKKVQI